MGAGYLGGYTLGGYGATSAAPVLTVEIAWTAGVWTDVSTDVVNLSIRRGRIRETDPIQAGTCSVTLYNTSGDYDPTNASGPYYPNVLPMREIRIKAVWSGVTYQMFRGWVEDFPAEYGYVPTVELDCYDPVGFLAAADVWEIATPSFEGDTTGARIGRILDLVGWDSTRRSINTGISTMPATQWSARAWSLITDAYEVENSICYANGNGDVVFRDRYTTQTATRSTTIQATFTDAGTADDYTHVTYVYAGSRIFNQWKIDRDGGLSQNAEDPASIAAYGRRANNKTLKLRSDLEALWLAERLVNTYKDPRLSVEQVTAEILPQGNFADVLGLDLLDLVRVTRNYGPNTITRDVLVQGLAWDVSDTSWALSLNTSASDPTQTGFVLNSSLLGTGTLTY